MNEENQPTLNEALSSAFDEVVGTDEGELRVTMDDTPELPSAKPQEVVETAEQKATRERDESGKFVAKPKEAGKEIQKEAKLDEAKGQTPTFEAPATWRPDAKAQWDALPIPVKAEIAKREREAATALNEATQKLASREKDGGELQQVLAPYAQEWGQRGVRTSEAIAQTLARAKYAYQNPEQFIREFAAETGVNLNLADSETLHDPEIAALKAEINGLKQGQQSWQQTQQQAVQQQNAAMVNSFADAKDEQGQPKHPHFDKVSSLMTGLMRQLAATEPHLAPTDRLGKAYEMACRAHPDVWQQMSEDMMVKNQTDNVQKQVAIANAAKAKAVSPSSTPSSGHAPSAQGSIRDHLLQAMGDVNRI